MIIIIKIKIIFLIWTLGQTPKRMHPLRIPSSRNIPSQSSFCSKKSAISPSPSVRNFSKIENQKIGKKFLSPTTFPSCAAGSSKLNSTSASFYSSKMNVSSQSISSISSKSEQPRPNFGNPKISSAARIVGTKQHESGLLRSGIAFQKMDLSNVFRNFQKKQLRQDRQSTPALASLQAISPMFQLTTARPSGSVVLLSKASPQS